MRVLRPIRRAMLPHNYFFATPIRQREFEEMHLRRRSTEQGRGVPELRLRINAAGDVFKWRAYVPVHVNSIARKCEPDAVSMDPTPGPLSGVGF